MLKQERSNKPQPWDEFLTKPAHAPPADLQAVTGKRILITGAGGYIGSALALFLSNLPVEQLLLMDVAEHGLYSLDQELQTVKFSAKRELIVGSVCDQALVQEIFDEHRPHIVFHAAAHKHVPLMEANPFAAAETNALGTRTLTRMAGQFKAEQFVLLATDKAVDPISIMGATKRLAELIVLANSSETPMKVLRLCNVLGSSGSVAPLFCQQIAQGKPVTLTHVEATRYFLSIGATVQYLVAAASSAYEAGLYIPPLDSPYRIEELAQFLIKTVPVSHEQNGIVHTGLRVGDKLHEAMISSREALRERDRVLTEVVGPFVEKGRLERSLETIGNAIQHRDLSQLLRAVEETVPEYSASDSLRSDAKSAVRRTR
jgi:FlaA1/EpsC-like NDP-sugar epimerase